MARTAPACIACSPLRRTAIWIGRIKASKASSAFWDACIGLWRATRARTASAAESVASDLFTAASSPDSTQAAPNHQARNRRFSGTLAFQYLHRRDYGVGERALWTGRQRDPAPPESIPAALLAEVQRDLVLLLAPFAPYLAHELWEMLGEKGSLLRAPWPKYDPALAKEDEIEVPVQVNGKLRGLVRVSADAAQEVLQASALADEKVKALIAGKQIVKVIVVPGKLVNIVVR